MSELTTLARPYAKAAFEFAVEQKAIAKWQEMLWFANEVAISEQIAPMLSNALYATRVSELFINVCGEQLNEQGKNLIQLMAENGRLSALPAVFAEFCNLKAEYEKEITAEVISSQELTEQQKISIQQSLEKRLDRKVLLECSIDATLIAGVMIRTKNYVIDGTVRGKLNRMAEALQS